MVILPETPAGPAPSKYCLSPQNSAPPTNIPPTISSICSWTRLTTPEDTLKSVELNDAIPLLDVLASSPATVTIEPDMEVSIPSSTFKKKFSY